jgi:hypothetical protein
MSATTVAQQKSASSEGLSAASKIKDYSTGFMKFIDIAAA